jgi:actin-related protein
LSQKITDSVNKCPFDVKSSVFSNLIVSGGLVQFKNFSQLFSENMNSSANNKKIRESLAYRKDELQKYFQPSKLSLKINIHPEAGLSAFKGGCMIADQEFFKARFISKQIYEEFGESIVRRHFYAFK